MSTYVVYHANCVDGFASAYAAWKKFGDEAIYHASSYGDEPPAVQADDRLLVLDFSYPKETVRRLLETVKDFLLIDHHATAMEELCEFISTGKVKISANINSGCILTWQELHPKKDAPWYFDFIEDRDLWTWRLPKSREVNAFIQSQEMNFDSFDDLGERSEAFASLIGTQLLRAQCKLVELMLKSKTIGYFGETSCVVCNATVLQSEMGDALLNLCPQAEVALIWRDSGNGNLACSLRSRRGGPHCGHLASKFGGGGHANSSGFTVSKGSLPFSTYPQKVLIKTYIKI